MAIIKTIFKYRGRRIRKVHLYDWVLHYFLLLTPCILGIGYLTYKFIYPKISNFQDYKSLILPSIFVLLFLCLVNLLIFVFM
jgi:hypothetical protein